MRLKHTVKATTAHRVRRAVRTKPAALDRWLSYVEEAVEEEEGLEEEDDDEEEEVDEEEEEEEEEDAEEGGEGDA